MERCALYWLAVSALFAGCLAETVEMEMAPDVEIVQRPQFLYSTISPKLRIQGKGFGKVPGDIHLSFIPALSTKGTPMYNLSCTDTVMSIGLQAGPRRKIKTPFIENQTMLKTVVCYFRAVIK